MNTSTSAAKKLLPESRQALYTKFGQRLLMTSLVIVLFFDVGVALLILKRRLFPFSLSLGDYLEWIETQLSVWTGRLFWLSVFLFCVLVPLVLGRAVKIPEFSKSLERVFNAIGKTVASTAVAIRSLCASIVVAVFLLLALQWVTPVAAPPVSGKLVIPTDPATTKMFVVRGTSVLTVDRTRVDPSGHFPPLQILPLTDSGEISRVAVAYDLKRFFATDPNNGLLHIVDTESGSDSKLAVGRTVGPLALSGDGRKLFVGIVGPIPEGQIQVFDTKTLKQTAIIRGVGCPVDLYATPRASLLFVATQCGGGHDPLYIVDTKSNAILKKVPDLAVGSRVVATPDGSVAFVSTGDRLSTIRDGQVQDSLFLSVGPLAITSDGSWLFIGTLNGIKSMNVHTGKLCSGVGLEATPDEIAISPDGAIYAIMPTRLFVSDIKALQCK